MENPPYVELTNIGVVSQWCQPQTVVVSLGQVRIFGFQCQVFFYVLFAVGPIFIHAFFVHFLRNQCPSKCLGQQSLVISNEPVSNKSCA